jgi:Fe2+ transport system protein FeoA
MVLPPLTLAEMGRIFWGADWARPLGEMMRVSKQEIVAMAANPQTIPPGMEERLQALGMIRIQEIQVMLDQLKQTGINRKPLAP